MIVAIDVHYKEDYAKSVSVEFQDWSDATPSKINITRVDDVEEYIPGQFYKRELPCILSVLKETDLSVIDLVIIDGYVQLSDDGKPGLGVYLYDALNGAIPIIGVAKKKFINNKKHVREVLRGESQNPLYITSVGVDLEWSAKQIGQMAGDYRFPELLKILDQHTKSDME